MSLPVRAVTVLVAFIAVAAGVAFVIVHYLLGPTPPTVDFTAQHAAGQPVSMTIQTDPVNDASSTPDWVSYFVKSPQTGKWVHSTIWRLPAGTRVNVTAYEYDTCDPIRNPIWGQVTGTVGGVMHVSGAEGGASNGAVSTVNSYTTCAIAHTFNVPGMNINVPFAGVLYTAKNQCAQAPCVTSNPHTVTTFSFITPRKPGIFRWQCFIPCGLASLDGNGHAMSTVGFMTGFLKVVAS